MKATLDAPDPETGEIHTVPYADLDSDVEDVEKEIKGSKENVKIFQDIGRKAQGIGDTGADEEELVMMSPQERKAAMQFRVQNIGTRRLLPGSRPRHRQPINVAGRETGPCEVPRITR